MVTRPHPAISPKPALPSLWRIPLRLLSVRRGLRGGRLDDLGRLPRYLGFFLLGAALIWAPITGYLKTAPLRYASHGSLILPGSGASASVNLNEIGQASSYANSAFASNAISPTETYKRLLAADRIVQAAADRVGVQPRAFGKPRVTLVDQTGMIHLRLDGPSPAQAQARAQALLNAFFEELDRLRQDEQQTREGGGQGAIQEYYASVQATRAAITALQRETGLHSAGQYKEQVAANDRLRDQLETLRAQLQQRSGAVAKLSTQLGVSPDQAAAALKLFADREYLTMMTQMAQSASDLAGLRARFGPQHPDVTRARAAHEAEQRLTLARATALTGLSAQALAHLDLAPDGARADLLSELVRQETERAGLHAQTETLARRLMRETARLDRAAPQAAQLEDMQRDFDVAEAVFASAIARAQSSKSDIYASYPLVQVLEDPTLAERPSSPNRKLALVAGAGATVFLLIGLAMGWVRRRLIDGLLGTKAARS